MIANYLTSIRSSCIVLKKKRYSLPLHCGIEQTYSRLICAEWWTWVVANRTDFLTTILAWKIIDESHFPLLHIYIHMMVRCEPIDRDKPRSSEPIKRRQIIRIRKRKSWPENNQKQSRYRPEVFYAHSFVEPPKSQICDFNNRVVILFK